RPPDDVSSHPPLTRLSLLLLALLAPSCVPRSEHPDLQKGGGKRGDRLARKARLHEEKPSVGGWACRVWRATRMPALEACIPHATDTYIHAHRHEHEAWLAKTF